MSHTGANNFAIILIGIWITFFVYMWLFWIDIPGRPKGTKRYKVLWDMYFKPKRKIYCAYHATKRLKIGQVALIDQINCQICLERKKAALR